MYSYMIHTIAKTYGITKTEACRHTEYDFWEMMAFENLDSKKEEFLIKQNNNS